jgi:putative hydrolases of HD superfamily
MNKYSAMEYQDRLNEQFQFLIEIDKLKNVVRTNVITDKSRRENSAEHSWHLALLALILGEHADKEIDRLKVVKMLLIHDIVEIDAGDVIFTQSDARQTDKEVAAAKRIFSLLPADQAQELIELWQEFEAGETAEARFAKALDRVQPALLHEATDGMGWQAHDLHVDQIHKRMHEVKVNTPRLWPRVKAIIDNAVLRGRLRS